LTLIRNQRYFHAVINEHVLQSPDKRLEIKKQSEFKIVNTRRILEEEKNSYVR